jgi:hypothetical protein
MGIKIITTLAACAALACADGPGRIYTQPQAGDSGAITGRVDGGTLTHAIAVERDRTRVFLAQLADQGTSFRFSGLPVGRYDIVLVTADGRVCEGLNIGDLKPDLPAASRKFLEERVTKADSFFNRFQIHRIGFSGDRAFLFVERLRDRTILRQSGENLGAYLRRFEIIEMQEATDDWQMIGTRHLYREETPIRDQVSFSQHHNLPALGGLRVADSARDAGLIHLPTN